MATGNVRDNVVNFELRFLNYASDRPTDRQTDTLIVIVIIVIIHHRNFSGLNSEYYCKDHFSGEEMVTRRGNVIPESNSLAAAEQVCLQPVVEHRQRRGRRNIAWQAIPHLCSSNRKGTTSDS